VKDEEVTFIQTYSAIGWFCPKCGILIEGWDLVNCKCGFNPPPWFAKKLRKEETMNGEIRISI